MAFLLNKSIIVEGGFMMIENIEQVKHDLTHWVREQMSSIGATKAVVGISGGKDSSTVAALMVHAIGKDNVFGVLMPDGEQKDIDYAIDLCRSLDIKYEIVSIDKITSRFKESLSFLPDISKQTILNMPPRIRMTMLYAISQSILGSLVINTSNLSEDWIGYATIYGDTTGAFSPLATFTTDEVIQLGLSLGLDEKFVVKPPADGLTGKTDEEVIGFSYEVLNKYIREGVIEDSAVKEKIDRMHRISRFKFLPITMYHSNLPIRADDIAGIYHVDRER